MGKHHNKNKHKQQHKASASSSPKDSPVSTSSTNGSVAGSVPASPHVATPFPSILAAAAGVVVPTLDLEAITPKETPPEVEASPAVVEVQEVTPVASQEAVGTPVATETTADAQVEQALKEIVEAPKEIVEAIKEPHIDQEVVAPSPTIPELPVTTTQVDPAKSKASWGCMIM